MKNTNTWQRVLSLLFAFVMIIGVTVVGAVSASAEEQASVAENSYVAEVAGTPYATLQDAVTAASAIDGGATVTLLADAELNEKITVSGNVTVSGNFTLKRSDTYTGTLFSVDEGATLTIGGGLVIDGNNVWTLDEELYARALALEVSNLAWGDLISSEEAKPSATGPMFRVYGAVVLNDVTIQNNYSSKESNSGDYGVFRVEANATLTMSGATVKHVVTGGANSVVHLAENSVWTINDGTLITDTFAARNGGICRNDSGLIVMNGGEISGNRSINTNGGAFMMYKGELVMNGGVICSNSGISGASNGRCAVIYLHNSAKMTMNGGEICHNHGINFGGIDSANSAATLTITGGYVGENLSSRNSPYKDINVAAGTALISGGIFTQDVSTWCAPGFMVVNLLDGTYGVVEDPIYGKEASIGDTYYATFFDALEAAVKDDVIVVHKTVVLTEDGTVDLKGARVNASGYLVNTPVFRILADVTFTNGIVDGYGEGGINSYAFIVGDSETAGTLTITDGTYRGVTSAVSITNGTVNILGGTFQTKHDGEGTDYGTTYLLNCIDSAYNNGSAKFNITGGKFVGFNPESNAAEGEGTNFLAEGYKASDYYDNDKWYVARALVVMDGDKYFETVKDALAILASADTEVHTVKLLSDITVDVNYSTYNYPILVNGFVLVLDLNGKTMTADWSSYSGTRVDNALIGVCNGGKLTVTDSVGGGKIVNNDTRSDVENRIFWIMTGTAAKELIVNIDGGTFVQNDVKTALLYIQGNSRTSTDMGVYVYINGGHFVSVNDDFFNAYDGYKYEAWVRGGTFNKDPRDHEIRIPDYLTSYATDDGYWGITEAVATVGNNGYESLSEAITAATDGATVVLNVDVTVGEPIVIEKSITLDLGTNTVNGNGVYPVIRVQGDASVTVKNGSINNSDYVFVLGASDGSSAGYLTIEDGSYLGATTVASVTKGKLVILGGELRVTDDTYGYRYLLNCIDSSYSEGSAEVEVKGGSFFGFNPASNLAEGEGTSFLADGYYVEYDANSGFYAVRTLIVFRSSNLLLGNTIGIYFNLNTADLEDGVNYVAVFTIHGTEYTVPRYDELGNSNWVVTDKNPEITRILFEGIAAKEMTLPVSVVLMLGDTVVSDVARDSVKSYVERGIALGVFTERDMDLVVQMLNYGALAQQSFDYNVDDLPNTGSRVALNVDKYIRDNGVYKDYSEGTHYYGASLNLENNVGFNFKFYADELVGVEKAVITYVNHTGKSFKVEIGVDEFKSETKRGRSIYAIHLDTLVAADARQLLTCKLYNAEGETIAYAKDSIESYCARAIAGLSAMSADDYANQSFGIEFYQALMKYSNSAYDYDPNTAREEWTNDEEEF